MKTKKFPIHFIILAILFFVSTLEIQADIMSEHYSIIKKKRYKKRYYKKSKKNKTVVLSNSKKWQIALSYLGFYHGKINGNMNSFDTHHAIKQFQQAHQVSVTGLPNQAQKGYLSYIYKISTIAKYLNYEGKNKRSNGKKYQAALKVHSVYHDKIDGAIGKGTKKSILAYKYKIGLDTQDSALSNEEKKALVNSAKVLLTAQQTDFKLTEDSPIIQTENNGTIRIPQKSTIEKSTEEISRTDQKTTNSPSKENSNDTPNTHVETTKSILDDKIYETSEYNSSISDDITNIVQEIVQSTKEITTQK